MNPKVVVIVSADGEWQAVPKIFPDAEYQESPYGQYFVEAINGEPVVIMHGGWGKIPALHQHSTLSTAGAQNLLSTWVLVGASGEK